MRNLRELDHCRVIDPRARGWTGDHRCGAFLLRSIVDGAIMACIASSDGGWEHVSASRRNRCPNWREMEQVKRCFFKDDETAMQLHVPAREHINDHPYCLHLWRPTKLEIPRPPAWMVGGEMPPDEWLDKYFAENP